MHLSWGMDFRTPALAAFEAPEACVLSMVDTANLGKKSLL
jgi:hypothetical protein